MAKQPDILLIMTEQQRHDTIASLGHPHMETPQLDRLVREGVTFTHAFVAGPTCVASRASLFNGLFAHTSGVLKNQSTWHRSFVENLARAGYHCVNFGKMHTNPYDAESGFHERYIVENKDRVAPDQRSFIDEWDRAFQARGLEKPLRNVRRRLPTYQTSLGAFDWDLPADLHADNFIGNLAISWMEEKNPDKPLFLQVGFAGPHPPYEATPEVARQYLNKELPVLPVDPLDIAGQPRALDTIRKANIENDRDSIVFRPDASDEDRHRQRAYYLANITMIDEKIGQIIEAYQKLGRDNGLIIFFTSDHGDTLGDHGHSQKWTMYDTVVRVPVIVWAPHLFAGGLRHSDMIQTMDIGATILELAQAPAPEVTEAVSFRAALEGKNWQGRKYVFCEQARDRITDTSFITMVRSREHKLVHYLGEPSGQLFDLEADPDEQVNLWAEPSYEQTRRDLLDVLRDWLIESNAATQDYPAGWR